VVILALLMVPVFFVFIQRLFSRAGEDDVETAHAENQEASKSVTQ
jgi:hypothetical protein